MKFDGEICGGVLVENASDDFPSKRSSKISCQTSPEVRHQFRRKLRKLHSGNRLCLLFWIDPFLTCTSFLSRRMSWEAFNLKFRRVTIRGAQPSARLSEEIRLSERSAGVSPRALRGLSEGSAGSLRGSAGVRRIFRGFSGVVTLCL